MNLKLLLGSITFAMLTGCTSIYFDNGVPEKVNNQSHLSSQWHHNFAYALYEGSDAVDLSEHCPQGQWQTVHTYKSFSNAVAEVVVNQVGPVWYPRTVEVQCNKVPFKAK